MLMANFYKLNTLFACLVFSAAGASAAGIPIHKATPMKIVNTAPAVKEATEITSTGFTANWEAVAGAEGYCVFVYEPVTITEAGRYKVLDEGFNLVNVGSTVEPVWHEGFSCSLDKDYDFTFTPDWTVIGAAFSKGMVSGNVYTPTIDLTNNGGKYTLVLDIVGQMGTKIRVTSTGKTTEVQEAVLNEPGGGVLSFDFDNGSHETYLYIVDMGIEGDDDGTYADVFSFFDNISIEQDLNAGDTVLRLVAINDAVDAPATSCRFDDMKFLYNASHLCYDLYAAYIFYDDPWDPWDYDIDYSNFSALQHVELASSGINTVTVSPAATDGETVIYDLQGRIVGSDTSALRPGIYVTRNGSSSHKIVIK